MENAIEVKRGRGRPKGSKPVLPAIKPQELLKRYQNGEVGTEIAKSLGVSHQALYAYLLKHCEEDWQSHQVARALAEYEIAKERFETLRSEAKNIEDHVQAEQSRIAFACVREQLKSAQWELEKLCRRLFGQDQQVTSAGFTINIGVNRSRDEQVIHSAAVQLTHGNTGITDQEK